MFINLTGCKLEIQGVLKLDVIIVVCNGQQTNPDHSRPNKTWKVA